MKLVAKTIASSAVRFRLLWRLLSMILEPKWFRLIDRIALTLRLVMIVSRIVARHDYSVVLQWDSIYLFLLDRGETRRLSTIRSVSSRCQATASLLASTFARTGALKGTHQHIAESRSSTLYAQSKLSLATFALTLSLEVASDLFCVGITTLS